MPRGLITSMVLEGGRRLRICHFFKFPEDSNINPGKTITELAIIFLNCERED
jgi:hypothetical protein